MRQQPEAGPSGAGAADMLIRFEASIIAPALQRASAAPPRHASSTALPFV